MDSSNLSQNLCLKNGHQTLQFSIAIKIYCPPIYTTHNGCNKSREAQISLVFGYRTQLPHLVLTNYIVQKAYYTLAKFPLTFGRQQTHINAVIFVGAQQLEKFAKFYP